MSKIAIAAIALIAGCTGFDDPVAREPDLAALPKQDYSLELPDGRVAVGTGVRIGDRILVEGDILIPAHGNKGPGPNAAVTPSLWPSRVIVYDIDPALDPATRQQVLSAMDPWRSLGFLFRQRTTQNAFVQITTGYPGVPSYVCATATVGYAPGNTYYAGRNCRRKDFVHEWGHVLGLFHEHSRIDRDDHVWVNVDRIGGTIAGRGGYDLAGYDFDSVMHYDAYDRNADGSVNAAVVLIRPLDGRPLGSFGWNESPSAGDASALSALYANRAPGVPLFQMYNDQVHDFFYTIDPSERDTAVVVYGYGEIGPPARLVRDSEGGTAPFYRFYKGAPQTDHFYTSSSSEFNSVISWGWEYERIEGYLFVSQVEGTLPLYRYSHFDGATGDLMHFYTENAAMRPALENAGWGLDGVAGYAYPP